MNECKKCGYENNNESKYCANCGAELSYSENNKSNNNTDDYKIKCSKCGYLNDYNEQNCKNCGLQLLNKIENNKAKSFKVSKVKNISLFSLFIILYNIIPFILFLSLANMDNNLKVIGLRLTGLVVLIFFTETLACLTVKLIAKNTEYLTKCLFVYEIICILLYTLFWFVYTKNYLIIFIFIGLRILSWFIARKIILKEKIKNNKKILILFIIYIVLITLISNAFAPTKLNKLLFKNFGSPMFSNKELQIEIIEEYNSKVIKEISYFHKLTDKELSKITELSYIESPISSKDLNKLPYLTSVSLTNSDDKILDVRTNKKLRKINISSKNIESIKLNENIENVEVYSNLSSLDISNLNKLSSLNGIIDKLVVKDEKQLLSLFNEYNSLYFNGVEFNNNKSISLKNDGYMNISYDSYSYYHDEYNTKYEFEITDGTKISDVICDNIKIEVIDGFTEDIKKGSDFFNSYDIIKIYDNNDKLILSAEVRINYNEELRG